MLADLDGNLPRLRSKPHNETRLPGDDLHVGGFNNGQRFGGVASGGKDACRRYPRSQGTNDEGHAK